MHLVGRLVSGVRRRLFVARSVIGIWIDVGAHYGERTLGFAECNPGVTVYAFEPNLRAAMKLFGRSRNYIVLPMAVAENDGSADFYLNEFEASSSLLPLAQDAPYWSEGTPLRVKDKISVATIRLDTFMNTLGIAKVDFLKVDAQGMDLAVVRSAGHRLRDIARITLEVWVTRPQYSGAASKEEAIQFLTKHGFKLEGVEPQTDGHEENLTFVRQSH